MDITSSKENSVQKKHSLATREYETKPACSEPNKEAQTDGREGKQISRVEGNTYNVVQGDEDVDMAEFEADDNAPKTTPEDKALFEACNAIDSESAATLSGKEAILKKRNEDGSETIAKI